MNKPLFANHMFGYARSTPGECDIAHDLLFEYAVLYASLRLTPLSMSFDTTVLGRFI